MKTNRLIRISAAPLGFALVAIMASSGATRATKRVLPILPVNPGQPLYHYALDDDDPNEANLGSSGGNIGVYRGSTGVTTKDTADLGYPAVVTNVASRSWPTNTDARMSVDNITGFPTTQISCSFWVKTSGTNAGTPVSYAVDGVNSNEFLIYDTRNLRVYIRGTNRLTGISVNDGEWHHIAATWDSTNGQIDVYKDGSLEYTTTGVQTGNSIRPDGTFVLGQEQDIEDGNFSNWQALRGKLDDVRVFNTVLTQANVLYLANLVDPPGIITNNDPTFFLPAGSPVNFTFNPGVAPWGDVPGNEIYYTTNGNDPAQAYPPTNATPFSGPVDLTLAGQRVAVKARAYDNSGTLGPSQVMTWYFSDQYAPTQASQGILVPGVYSRYYNGTGPWLPDFSTLIPEQRTLEQNFNINTRTQNTNFGYEFEGFLQIGAGEEGIYHFDTVSDDGSKFFISDDGTNGEIELVDNDGPHGMRRRTGFLWLDPGFYAIRVPFSQGTGNFGLNVEWRGPATGDVRITLENGRAGTDYPITGITDRLFSTPLTQTPVLVPVGGTYPVSVTVDMSSEAGTILYYTTNGDAPDQRSFKGGGFTNQQLTLTQTSPLRVIAYDTAGIKLPSTIAREDYTIVPSGPPQLVSVVNKGNPNQVEVTFDRPVTQASAENTSFYSLLPAVAVTNATLQGNGQTVVLDTGALTGGVTYTLTVDGDPAPDGVRDVDSNSPIPAPGATGTFQFSATGRIFREWWDGISGSSVGNLTSNAAYPNSPSGSDQPLNFQNEDPANLGTLIVNWKDNYGTRFRGYFIPDQTGQWYFRISSDDRSELYLSTDSSPANKVLISQVTAWTGSRSWNDSDVMPSPPITLTAGERYYIESLQKEGGGGDSIAVRAQFQNSVFVDGDPPIPGSMLAPFLGGGSISNPGAPRLVSVSPVDATTVTVVFDRDVDPNDPGGTAVNPANYDIQPGIGNPGSVSLIDPRTVQLTTSTLSANTVYTLTVTGVLDFTLNNANPGESLQFAFQDSGITRKWWLGIGGGSVSNLTTNAAFPDNPTGSEIDTDFDGPVNWNDNYGTQYQGYFIPEVAGDYVFAISSDDRSELWMSLTGNTQDPANKVLISRVNAWTGWRKFQDPDVEQSDTLYGVITLPTPGQRYYIEALQKEGGGGDSVSVAFTRVDIGQPLVPVVDDAAPIVADSGSHIFLVPFEGVEILQLTKHPEDRYVLAGATVTFEVQATGSGPIQYQWFKDGSPVSIPSSNNTLTLFGVQPSDVGAYHAVVTQQPFGLNYSLNSQTANLYINDSVPPQLVDAAPAVVPNPPGPAQVVVLVVFDELIDPATAEDEQNYSLVDDRGTPVAINLATLQPDGMTVELQTGDICNGIPYTLTINPTGAPGTPIQDLSVPANVLFGTPDVQKVFTPTGKPTLGIRLHWALDETDPMVDTAVDTSGFSPPATGTLLSDFLGQLPTWTSDAAHKGALLFDGAEGQVVDGVADVSAGDYTVSLWFKTTDPEAGIFALTFGAPGQVPLTWDRILFLQNGQLFARVFSDVTCADEYIATTGPNLADGMWHNVVHVMGGAQGGQKLFIDGQPQTVDVYFDFIGFTPDLTGQAGGSATGSCFSTTGVRIGEAGSIGPNNQYFTGRIDDVRVYNRALTDQEITDVANPNWPPEVELGPDRSVTTTIETPFNPVIFDENPGGLTYSWTVLQDPGTPPSFNPDATTQNPGITFPVDGTYLLHLEVDDGELKSCDRVQVTAVMSLVPEGYFVAATSQSVEPQTPTTVDIEVGLTAASVSVETVNWATSAGGGPNNTATEDADYVGASGVVTFQPGEVRQTIQVTINDDMDANEFLEDFTITLTAGSVGVVTGQDTHIHTIQDDDSPPTVEFTLASSSVDEGIGDTFNPDAFIEVSLSWPYNQAVTVDYTVTPGSTNPATAGGVDYDSFFTSVTIPMGSSTATIPIRIIGDALDEQNEQVELTLTAATPLGVGITGNTTHTLTIIDNDLPPVVQFTVTSGMGSETAGSDTIQVQLVDSNGFSTTSGQQVTVLYDIVGGTATGNSVDYTLPNGQVTFNVGESTKDITIGLVDDVLPEGPETVVIQLNTPTNASIGTSSQFIYTITDDDSPPEITFDSPASSGSEANTAVDILVNLTQPSGTPITVDYVVNVASTATSPDDYALLGTGLITFDPGVTQVPIQLTIVNDFVIEPDETIVIDLQNPVPTSTNVLISQHTYTIVNDDINPTLSISNPPAFTEGSGGGTQNLDFTVTLLPANTTQTVTVNYVTMQGTATDPEDYTGVTTPTQISFSPGTTSQTISIPIVRDDIHENTHTFTVVLSGEMNALLGTDTATGTINDDDAAPTISLVQISGNPVDEATAPVAVQYEVQLAGNQSEIPITANILTAPGSTNPATPDVDYTSAPSVSSVTFPALDLSPKPFTVTVLADAIGELNEEYDVSLSGIPAFVTQGTVQVTTIIGNDDPATFTISNASYTEGSGGGLNQVTYTVNLFPPPAGPGDNTTVTISTVDTGSATGGGVDYNDLSQLLTFNQGESSKQVTLEIVRDDMDEPNETFDVSLTGIGGTWPANTNNGSTATITITDDDPVPTISAVFSATSVAEGPPLAGGNTITVTVSLSNPSSQAITVQWRTVDGTAFLGSDYTGGSASYVTLDFPPGSTSPTQGQIVLTTVPDTAGEPNETFDFELANASAGSISTPSTTLTILNDDQSVLDIDSVQVTEPDGVNTVTMTFTVTLTPADPTNTVTVNWTTFDTGSATEDTDYVGASGTLQFDPNDISKMITITINGDDLDEPTETFEVRLSGATNATINTATGIGTIIDNDQMPTISINNPIVTEGNPGDTVNVVFNVSLSAPSGRNVTFDYGIASGSALDGTDFDGASATPTSPITINASQTSATITVPVIEDFLDEGASENFTLTLSSAQNASFSGGGGTLVSTATITDDDTAGFIVSPPAIVTSEGGLQATFTVRLTSQPAPGQTVMISLTSSNTSQGTVSPPSLTFDETDWDQPQTVTVTGLDDSPPVSGPNPDYTIFTGAAVSGDPNYSGLNPPDVTVSHTDNDVPGVAVSPIAGLTTDESGATATFNVVLNTQPSANVDILVSTGDNTEGQVSSVASPIQADQLTLTFTNGNWDQVQVVTVHGLPDSLLDGDITYSIVTGATQSGDGSYNGLTVDDVSVTNTDLDLPTFTVNPTSGLTTTESGGQATFTIVLDSQPLSAGNVSIPVSSDNTAEGTVSPTTVTFTPGTWDQPQTVTITGVDDAINDGDVLYNIILGPATGNPDYAGQDPPDVSVTNQDNDIPGVAVSPTSGLTTTEAGGTASFTVALNTVPTDPVTITLSSNDTGEGTIPVAQLVFNNDATALNPQTVVITGVNDTLDDGDIPFTIVLDPVTSNDPDYGVPASIDPNDVSVTNLDDDTFNVTGLSPDRGSTAGGTAVTITGTNLGSVQAVTFGSAGAGSITGNTDTMILVDTPSTVTAGPVNVTLTLPDNGGVTTSIGTFTYIDPALAADLSIVKTVSNGLPPFGSDVTYTITVSNAGQQNADNVEVTDLLPAGLSLVSATPGQGTYDSGTGVWTIGTINNGGNAVLTIVVTVTSTGLITNTAEITASDQQDVDSVPGNGDPFEDDQSSVDVLADLRIQTAPALPDGTAGAFYSQTVVATGGVPPYTWTWLQLAGETLPFNLNSNTGEISGVAPTPGSHTFTLRVSDAQNPSDTNDRTFTLTINSASGLPTINTPAPPDATVGVPYSYTFTANGGVPPYTWAHVGGTMPGGLSLNPNTGELSGIPDTAGGVSIDIQVTDSNSPADSDTANGVTFTIFDNPVTLSPATLPDGQDTVFYSETLVASGGVGPFTWGLSGTAPGWLGITGNGSSATISGTAATGVYTFDVQVTDTFQGQMFPTTYTLTVTAAGPPTLTVTTTTVPLGEINIAYPQVQLSATGGTPGSYAWSIVGGALPNGLTLSAAGVISPAGGQTPTEQGTFGFTVEVTDGTDTAQGSLSMTIAPAPVITTTSPLPGAVDNQAYSTQLMGTGGVTPYNWNWTAVSPPATLPPGLTLDSTTGLLSGTVTGGSQTYTFDVQITDSLGGTSVTVLFSLTVTAPGAAPTITTTSLPRGTVGTPYSTTVSAIGGLPSNYSWSEVTVPAALLGTVGLSIDAATGVISGTPTVSGPLVIDIQVDDVVNGTDTVTLTLNIDDPLTISTNVPIGVLNAPYSGQLTANGAVASELWTILSGQLPGGLTLDPATGAITGTPSQVVTAVLQIQVTDGIGRTAQRQVTVRIVLTFNGSSNDRDCSIGAVSDGPRPQAGVLWTALLAAAVLIFAGRRRRGAVSCR